MNYIVPAVSLTVWSGLSSGIGASLFLPHVSSTRAAIVGGCSVTSAVAAIGLAYFANQDLQKSGDDEAFKCFLRNWAWVSFVPLIGIPYLAGLSAATGIAIISLGMLGVGLKAATVGIKV